MIYDEVVIEGCLKFVVDSFKNKGRCGLIEEVKFLRESRWKGKSRRRCRIN